MNVTVSVLVIGRQVRLQEKEATTKAKGSASGVESVRRDHDL